MAKKPNILQPEVLDDKALSFLNKLLLRIDACNSIQDFTDASLELLGNPMLVLDVRSRLLACTEARTENPIYQTIQNLHSGIEHVTADSSWLQYRDQIWNSAGVIQQEIQGIQHLSCPLRAGGKLLGVADVPMLLRPFSQTDRVALELTAGRLSAVLAAGHTEGVRPLTELTQVLYRILEGEAVSSSEYKMASGQLRGQLCLLCVDAIDLDEPRRAALEKLGGLILEDTAGILILLADRNVEYNSEWCTAVREKLHPFWLHIGMSSAFDSLEDLRRARMEARSALSIGLRVCAEEGIYSYDQLRIFDLFRHAADAPDALARFLSQGMQRLIRADDTQPLDLLNTLYCWLSHNRSLQATASVLHIHRNTVTHRIGRAFELMGCSQDNGKELMRIATELQLMAFIDRQRYFGDGEEL